MCSIFSLVLREWQLPLKRSILSTVAAETERIDWIVFSRPYLFVRRQVTRVIYIVGLPSVVKHKYWISIDMDCRRWRHLQMYQHAIICYGIWLHDRHMMTWYIANVGSSSTGILVCNASCMDQELDELAYNLLQRIIVFVEQWLHVHHRVGSHAYEIVFQGQDLLLAILVWVCAVSVLRWHSTTSRDQDWFG